ncbi:hypothetical protein AMECASPLE_008824 [Ameca splendens]|uniref:Uncharacterized protein n=1 Tax=Ameca splendens TaxID=208324 RepID=A0ABV0Z9S9_9TELE
MKVAEDTGEVIQSRISPSHWVFWYSYHNVIPQSNRGVHLLNTDSLRETSFCHFTSPARLSALISLSSLYPLPASLSNHFLLISFHVVFLAVPPYDSPPWVFH